MQYTQQKEIKKRHSEKTVKSVVLAKILPEVERITEKVEKRLKMHFENENIFIKSFHPPSYTQKGTKEEKVRFLCHQSPQSRTCKYCTLRRVF